jgi:hypothetical protein
MQKRFVADFPFTAQAASWDEAGELLKAKIRFDQLEAQFAYEASQCLPPHLKLCRTWDNNTARRTRRFACHLEKLVPAGEEP